MLIVCGVLGLFSLFQMANLLLLLVAMAIFRGPFPTEATVSGCTGDCECREKTDQGGLYAKCTLTDLKKLSTFIVQPHDVKAL